MTEALRGVHQATTEAAAHHQAVQATAPEAAQATAREVQAADTAEEDQAEAAVLRAEEDRDKLIQF